MESDIKTQENEETFEPLDNYETFEYQDAQIVHIRDRCITDSFSNQISIKGEFKSQYIVFECERYMDGIDLAKMLLQIHYEREDGLGDNNKPINVRISDKHIRYGWVIPGAALVNGGTIKIMPFAIGNGPDGSLYLLKDLYVEYKIRDGLSIYGGIAEPPEEWLMQFYRQMTSFLFDAKKLYGDMQIAVEDMYEEMSKHHGIVISSTDIPVAYRKPHTLYFMLDGAGTGDDTEHLYGRVSPNMGIKVIEQGGE